MTPVHDPASGRYIELPRPWPATAWASVALLLALVAACLWVVDASLSRLWAGLPRLGMWLGRAWPPDFSDFPTLMLRAGETLAIGTLGTGFACILALPLALLAARPLTPSPLVRQPVRAFLDALRGVDGFIFALVFVAAVGLGPFAGMLGVLLHSAGSIAKLWSEDLESADPGPLEALGQAGAGRARVALFALLPDRLPSLASIALYVWEFNVRASTVLGVVGAGGLGQELKSAIDLLAFDRVFAILLVILALVTAIDRLGALIRRRLG
ncbi:phosphonate ABC transporter, permease protein PhnE [Aerophototrophica crusticola]|uniref:Phosphonate ABC transporter, permease protein PhnE n=1 Tax=Aerophototrophica crusticola TaxID=1709002 RepID=A0A858RA52_9PROT|nr:phosphonate ABC transporter, permease protein PhnE [Rhodospirillaceae bacterium B3]